LRVLFVTLLVVITDQLTKFLVKGGTIPLLNIKIEGMDYGQSINVIGDFFKITFVENPGLAFGIGVGDTAKLFLSIFSLIAAFAIFYYLYKSRHQKMVVRVALALILGGAIGNFIDRTFYGVFYGYAPIFYGSVVDFFNVDFFDFTIMDRTYDRWPIFNIADASVTVGVVLLVLFHHSVVEKEDDKKNIKSEEGIVDPVSNSEVVAIENSQIDNLQTSNPVENNVQFNNREEDKN